MQWHIERLNVRDLIPYESNPRKIGGKKLEDLKRSVRKFGLAEPLVVNTNGVLIGGHARLLVAQEDGEREIDCYMPDRELTEQEHAELAIRLNKNIGGEWDFDILANQFEIEDLKDWGFEDGDLGLATELDPEDEKPAPAAPVTPVVKPGDIFQLGPHRVMCGDSTEADAVGALTGEAKPVLMVTDPPYGVEYDPDWRNRADRANGKKIGARAVGVVTNDDRAGWRDAYSLFTGTIAYVWHDARRANEVQSDLEDCDFEVVNQIIWAKSNFAISRGDYHWKHEPCWYAVKKGANHNWQGSRSETTLWDIGKPQKSETGHSTQKPLECMARPIRNNTSAGQSVYDPFLGSGTTLIAADKLGRICYGMEISPAYIEVIVRRWAENCKGEFKHVNGNLTLEEITSNTA